MRRLVRPASTCRLGAADRAQRANIRSTRHTLRPRAYLARRDNTKARPDAARAYHVRRGNTNPTAEAPRAAIARLVKRHTTELRQAPSATSISPIRAIRVEAYGTSSLPSLGTASAAWIAAFINHNRRRTKHS